MKEAEEEIDEMEEEEIGSIKRELTHPSWLYRCGSVVTLKECGWPLGPVRGLQLMTARK